MDQLLGIDVGTGTVKALLFEPASGRVVAVSSRPLRTYRPRVDWVEFDPDELWQTVCDCLGELWARSPSDAVGAVGVASMAEAGVLLDDTGRPVYPFISWQDARTRPQAARLKERISPFEAFQITGQQHRHIYSLYKLLWLREHEPAAFRRGSRWLCVADYVLWRLAGEYVTDRTLAARTLAFDQETGTWSPRLLETAGLAPDLFAPVLASGTVVGGVTRRAAAETGLREGTAVVTGGWDHLCGALAVGMGDAGQILDSSGTAQSILTLVRGWNPTRAIFEAGFAHSVYVLDGLFTVSGNLPMAGGLLRWLTALLGGEQGRPSFDELLRAAAEVPAGANGVICLPYLLGKSGPEGDSPARGAFLGLTPSVTAPVLVRAALESLAYHLREIVEALDSLVGPLAREIIAIGGTNQGDLLPQIKADVTGCRVRVPDLSQAVALGAALLAGLGVASFATPAQAIAAAPSRSRVYEPRRELAEPYEQAYRAFREMARSYAQPPR